jgi:hypothetical protein
LKSTEQPADAQGTGLQESSLRSTAVAIGRYFFTPSIRSNLPPALAVGVASAFRFFAPRPGRPIRGRLAVVRLVLNERQFILTCRSEPAIPLSTHLHRRCHLGV